MRSNILITVIMAALVLYSSFITICYIRTKNKIETLAQHNSMILEKLNAENERVQSLKQSLDEAIYTIDSLTYRLQQH